MPVAARRLSRVSLGRGARVHQRAVGGPQKKLADAALRIIDGGRTAAESAAAASALGLTSVGYVEPDDLDVWPEHWQAVQAFIRLGTQWQVGMGGPVGLRYEAIPIVLDLQRVDRDEWPHVFDCLRVLEAEALRVFAERQEQRGS